MQSAQEPQPTHGGRREVLFYLLGVLGFVVAGFPVRPSLSCCFNVFRPDRSLRLQIQLVNDDEKFTCYSPQGPTGAQGCSTLFIESVKQQYPAN